MQEKFKAISISYKTAPLGIREKLALTESEAGHLLRQIKDLLGIEEALVISTCNRTEVYYSAYENLSEKLVKLIGLIKGINASELTGYFTSFTEELSAIRHLFDVSMGLESQVVGDIQISNQIKRAYQLSADIQLAGPYLHRLMHTIFFTNKKVVQETAFRDGAASVSYAAVELIQELAMNIADPRILVIGVGEIGTDVVKNLASAQYTNVAITNRTAAKAISLAESSGFEAIPFESCWEAIADADIIISSISTDQPFFNKENVGSLDLLTFKYFVDLSVPRSVASEVEQMPGALVFNIDQINSRAKEAVERRIQAIPAVRAIIDEAIEDFSEWTKEMIFSPTIQKFKTALEEIRKKEMAKYLKQVESKEQQELIDKITMGMMNQIVKMPVLQLKAACRRGEAEELSDLLNDLFNLEKPAGKLKT